MRPSIKRRSFVLVLLVAALVAGSILLGARARAASHERLLELGDLAQELPSTNGRVHALHINGARIAVLASHSPESASQALDREERACRALQTTIHLGTLPLGAFAPMLRVGGDRQGVVACLALGERLEVGELLSRAQRAVGESDPTELGALRVSWVFPEAGGSRVVSSWPLEPLPIARLFPAQGDAPGIDPTGVPRPAQSRRVLSALEARRVPALAGYASALAPARALQAYEQRLREAGFSVTRLNGVPMPTLFATGPRELLAFVDGDAGGGALLVLVPLASR